MLTFIKSVWSLIPTVLLTAIRNSLIEALHTMSVNPDWDGLSFLKKIAAVPFGSFTSIAEGDLLVMTEIVTPWGLVVFYLFIYLLINVEKSSQYASSGVF